VTCLTAFTAAVTVNYAQSADLTGTHTFSGTAGPKAFTLTMDNNVTFSGTSGGQSQVVSFAGSGQWAIYEPAPHEPEAESNEDESNV
jgi:hypothetical protein